MLAQRWATPVGGVRDRDGRQLLGFVGVVSARYRRRAIARAGTTGHRHRLRGRGGRRSDVPQERGVLLVPALCAFAPMPAGDQLLGGGVRRCALQHRVGTRFDRDAPRHPSARPPLAITLVVPLDNQLGRACGRRFFSGEPAYDADGSTVARRVSTAAFRSAGTRAALILHLVRRRRAQVLPRGGDRPFRQGAVRLQVSQRSLVHAAGRQTVRLRRPAPL